MRSASGTLTVSGRLSSRNDERRDQAEDDQHHLLDVGPGDRLDAAEHRVDRRRHAHQQAERGDVEAHDHRQEHRRRGNDRPAGHCARDQEQERRERPRLRVEPPLEILVGGEDARVVEERHERHRQDEHRDRQRVIELDEAHAVGVALARRTDHRDRRQLRRHHRQADRPPRNAAARQKVAFELGRFLREAKAVPDDPHEVGAENRPIDPVHGQVLSR